MYDPMIGQFLSEDPIDFDGLDENLRRYVHNQPTRFVDPDGLSEKGTGGPVAGPTGVPKPPTGLEPGDIWIVVLVDQPYPGFRYDYEGPGLYDYGHCSIGVGGYGTSGKFTYILRGFFPTEPFASTSLKPQKGSLHKDYGRYYDVKHEIILKRNDNPGMPSIEEIMKYMEGYDDDATKQPYDLDDRNCANYVVDTMKFIGYPLPPYFGRIGVFNKGANRPYKYIITPSAVGEDLKALDRRPSTGRSSGHNSPPIFGPVIIWPSGPEG